MTNERYAELMESGAAVSPQEHNEGWHYCQEYDDLLMKLGDTGCECAPWKPVAMVNRIQALSRSMIPMSDVGEF